MELEKNHLYEIPLRIRRGPSCAMPAKLIGAYVICYASAPNHLEALKNSLLKLKNEGYIFEDLVNEKIYELDPLKWTKYVEKSWNEFKDHLPTQEEIITKVKSGGIFYGPFLGYPRD